MSDISAHFSRSEFTCKCGKCGFDTVDVELVRLCEIVRTLNGNKPTVISSGNRCIAHNKAVGGSELSQHISGKAADILVDDPQSVYDSLCELYPDKYGFGLYHNRVHVDCRELPARWIVE